MGVITTDNPKGAGRNTVLTDELFGKIKQSILDGNDLRKTASVCEIPESTLYTWSSDNYLDFNTRVEGWRRDRKLILADRNIEGILCLGVSDKQVIKVVADMSKFVKETLDKENYSKRSELTGKGGTQLIPENTQAINDLTSQLNEIYGGTSQSGDGKLAITLDSKVSD